MASLLVHPQTKPLSGSVPVPGDKSIAHRGLIVGALTNGSSTVRCRRLGDDHRSTLRALAQLGVQHAIDGDDVVLQSKGLYGWTEPTSPIDCGNSGTTMRLLAGPLAAMRFATRLVGDPSLSKRPMERVARPLRQRGGRIEGALDPKRPGECTPPLLIGPLPEPHVLSELEYASPVASAQVKSTALLSGLFSDGATYFHEPFVSRDHTERLLTELGVPLQRIGSMVALDGPGWSGELPSFELTVPGDLSSAAFLLAATLIVPESQVTVRDVGMNPTRTGFTDLLGDMGARLGIEPSESYGAEPVATLHAAGGDLVSNQLGGERLVRAIDEVPIAVAAMAFAKGISRVSDAHELRVKESDRIAALAKVLRAFGIEHEEHDDGLSVEGSAGEPVGGAGADAITVDSHGDHRIAMTAVVLGLRSTRPVRVMNADCISTSFPRFVGTLRALGAQIDVET